MQQLVKLFAVLLLAAPTAHMQYRHHGTAPLPSLLTPGKADPRLTKATLCDPKWHTAGDRHVTESTKRLVCANYGQTNCPGKGYEIDHLISIELGGSNDLDNLWPQPVDAQGVIGYHTKDVVENAAHRAVCSGRLTLGQAQRGIAGDWYQFAQDNSLLPSK
jgi:hypothetical protein